MAAFARGASNGGLTQLGDPNDCISDGGSVCGTTSGTGLEGARSVAVSPDGRHVYVASSTGGAVAAFVRDPASGALTQLAAPNNCISQGGSACGTTGGKGLNGARGVAVSPDGRHVYVASFFGDAVAAFARDTTSGALTQLAAPNNCVSQGGTVCGRTDGEGLDGARSVAVSPDGRHVYVASLDGSAVAAFARDTTSGALTQLAAPSDCISQGGSGCGTTGGKGLDGARSVAVSPDGAHVYVASTFSDAVAAFARDPNSGALTQLAAPGDCTSQGGGVCGTTGGRGLDGAGSVAASPDGKSAYAASFDSDAVAVLARDTGGGALTQLAAPNDCISQGGAVCGTTGGRGLNGAESVAVSPDGKSVYVASGNSDAVAAFSRELAPVCVDTSMTVASATPATIALACSDPNGDPITRSIVTDPAHGTLGAIDQAAGTVSYTPGTGFAGSDAFTFRASDGSELSNAATADLSVSSGPGDGTGPRVRISGAAVRLTRRGVAKLRLSCPASERECAGTLTLRTVARVKASARRRARVVALGRATFSIRGGRTARVNVRLSKRNVRLVKRLRKVRVRAAASARDEAGNTRTTVRTLTLMPAKRKRRARR